MINTDDTLNQNVDVPISIVLIISFADKFQN